MGDIDISEYLEAPLPESYSWQGLLTRVIQSHLGDAEMDLIPAEEGVGQLENEPNEDDMEEALTAHFDNDDPAELIDLKPLGEAPDESYLSVSDEPCQDPWDGES